MDTVGYEEECEASTILLVRSGIFGRIRGTQREFADPAQILFFQKGQSYRFLHPGQSGDTCTIITPASELIFETHRQDAAHANVRDFPFASSRVLASPRALLLHTELFSMLNNSSSLGSAEEIIMELVDEVIGIGYRQPLVRLCKETDHGRRRRRDLVEDTKTLLNTYMQSPLRLSSMAETLGCSPFYLSRVFAQGSGISIRGYLVRLRVQAAAQQICEGANDLTRLALDLGFFDHSHLTKTFVREFGIQPSAFRARIRTRKQELTSPAEGSRDNITAQ